MRPTTAVSLLAVTILVSAAFAAESESSSAPETGRKPFTAVGSGHGLTREDAEQVALEDARDKVVAELRRREPSLRWLPSLDDLNRWHIIKKIEHRDKPLEFHGRRYEVVDVTVVVSDRAFQEILRRDRQLLAAKLLAALVILLAVGAGYFRLEEMTRGYYTGTLRVLALAGIALVGVGLWLIF
jgi:hypothetical protein